MSCDHCKTSRPYSPQAKKAGEAMIEVLRHYKDQLTVKDARDACTFCRNTLEYDVRNCPYNNTRDVFDALALLDAEENDIPDD